MHFLIFVFAQPLTNFGETVYMCILSLAKVKKLLLSNVIFKLNVLIQLLHPNEIIAK